MGRPVFYRQRVRSQSGLGADQSRCSHTWPVKYGPGGRYLAGGLAHCFGDTIRFLEQDLLAQGPSQIMLPWWRGWKATSAGPAGIRPRAGLS